jgi:hypothetical protein
LAGVFGFFRRIVIVFMRVGGKWRRGGVFGPVVFGVGETGLRKAEG